MTPYNSALITGASSGIGRALAEALAAPGVTLHLGGRNANRLEQTAIACRAKGAVAHVAPVDVTNAEATAAWIAAAAPLDLVIANAGISGGVGIGTGETAAQARAIFATNLDGALNTAFPALETMAPGGTIAVVASVAAFIPTPGAPAYGAGGHPQQHRQPRLHPHADDRGQSLQDAGPDGRRPGGGDHSARLAPPSPPHRLSLVDGRDRTEPRTGHAGRGADGAHPGQARLAQTRIIRQIRNRACEEPAMDTLISSDIPGTANG